MKSETRGGAGWIRVRDELRRFVRSCGRASPRLAVFCTYDFDGETFAREILRILHRRGAEYRVLVLADRGAFQTRPRLIEARYNLSLVSSSAGIFHPKLFYLQAGERALAAVGSGNLTAGGLGGNLELVSFHDSLEPAGCLVTAAARAFLAQLADSRQLSISPSAKDILASIAGHRLTRDQGERHAIMQRGGLLSSLDGPLAEQMRRRVNSERSLRVTILSPFYTALRQGEAGVEIEALRRLERLFDCDATPYSDLEECPRMKPMPRVLGRPELLGGQQSPTSDEERERLTRRPTSLHAKAYLIETNRRAHLFFGSANLTLPALFRHNSNVEILQHMIVPSHDAQVFRAELDEFFPKEASESRRPLKSGRAAAPRGIVVGADLRLRGHGPVALEIEVRGDTRSLRIVRHEEGGVPVIIAVRKRRGRVDDRRELDRLGLADMSDEGDTWTCVFWEILPKGGRVPFVVNIPLAASARIDDIEATGADWLSDLVDEERGKWPPVKRSPGRFTSGESEDEAPDEDEEETGISELSEEEKREEIELAAVRHQGELDRVATYASIALRGILKRRGTAASRLERLAQVRDEVKKRLKGSQRTSMLDWIALAEKAARR